MIDNPPLLNRDNNGDPNINKALRRTGFTNHGSNYILPLGAER